MGHCKTEFLATTDVGKEGCGEAECERGKLCDAATVMNGDRW